MSIFTDETDSVILDDFCRICLRQYGMEQMLPLRSHLPESDNLTTIANMLVYVCGLPNNLSGDLPQRVCPDCVTQLEEAFRFCCKVKEKETLLERFCLNGSVLQRLISYEHFQYGSKSLNKTTQQSASMTSSMIDTSTNNDDSFPMVTAPDTEDTLTPVIQRVTTCYSGSSSPNIPESIVPDGDLETPTVVSDFHKSKRSKTLAEPAMEEGSAIKSEPVDISSDVEEYPSVSSAPQTPEPTPANRKPSQHYSIPRQPTQKAKPQPSSEEVYQQDKNGMYCCPYCPYLIDSRTRIKVHLLEHRALAEERFRCNFCGSLFRRRDHLTRHVNNRACMKLGYKRTTLPAR